MSEIGGMGRINAEEAVFAGAQTENENGRGAVPESAQMKAQEPKEQIRTHRVGTMTCGLVFVLYGILFLLHMVMPDLGYMFLFELWPVILILLGVEILAGCMRKNQENRKIVYDFPAVILVIIMTIFVIIMAAVDCSFHIEQELWQRGTFYVR